MVAFPPAVLSFVIGVVLDFFSGKNWIAKLAVALQIFTVLSVLVASMIFFGGMDH
jgi:hypothetical protein